jgi:hypothetical protein
MAKRGRKKHFPQLIGGFGFSPCFMTEAEFEEGYKSSVFYAEKDFRKEYEKHIAGMDHIANIAKIYIFKNWKLVKDWGNLEVVVKHGPTGDSTYYYAYKERIRTKDYPEGRNNIFLKFDKERKRKQNPVKTMDNVVLDPTDGDFSVTINGHEHWWIQDEAVIIIADYIEKQIKKQNDENSESSVS